MFKNSIYPILSVNLSGAESALADLYSSFSPLFTGAGGVIAAIGIIKLILAFLDDRNQQGIIEALGFVVTGSIMLSITAVVNYIIAPLGVSIP